MKGKTDYSMYGPTLLRVALGGLFLSAGLMKLSNPASIIDLMGQLGFPAATAFGWLVLLSEIIFGAAVLLGYQTKYTVWPLVAILTVATLFVNLPQYLATKESMTSIFFHLIAIAALVDLYLRGPGAYAVNAK